MKIVGINGLTFNPESGGIGKYIYHLLEYIINTKSDFDFEPLIFLPENARHLFKDAPAVQYQNSDALKSYERILKESFLWSNIIRKQQIDVLHSPISYRPHGCGGVSSIITVHDLSPFHYSNNFSFLRRNYLKHMIKKSVAQAQTIISVSEFTKQDLINTLNVPPDKIQVIHEGINAEKYQCEFSDASIASTLKKYKLDCPYLISVGHLEPRKNYERLIKAFAILKSQKKISHKLVIVGRQNWGWRWDEIYQMIDSLNLRDDIIFTRFVEDDELIILIKEASLFVTASVYEGFGFTPLESMAAGTAVAASNITSLPEVVGDAALLFDPRNVEDIAESIWSLLDDKEKTDDLVAKGLENIKRFSWKECCKRTTQVYSECAANVASGHVALQGN